MDSTTELGSTRSCEHSERYRETSAKLARRRSQFELATQLAQDEVAKRLAACRPPPFVKTFLESHWQDLLALTLFQCGAEHEKWQEYLTVMDELLWSAAPLDGSPDRAKLLASLPRLLGRLREGMQGLGLDPITAADFLNKLSTLHARQVQAQPKLSGLGAGRAEGIADAGSTCNETPSLAGEVLEWHADRLEELQNAYYNTPMTELLDPSVAETAAPVIEIKEPWTLSGSGLGSTRITAAPTGSRGRALDRTALNELRSDSNRVRHTNKVEDDYLALVRNLKNGTWIKLTDDMGTVKHGRLTWINSAIYFFTDHNGHAAGKRTAAALADELRNGTAVLIDSSPVRAAS